MIFTAVLVAVLFCQLRLRRYVPFVYWLTVVVVSVTGTLYTDILTDQAGGPARGEHLRFRRGVGRGLRHLVRARAHLVHPRIVTLPREAFYWLAVLVTFALGTAIGDWTLQLTGWVWTSRCCCRPGSSWLISLGWGFGANPVLAFWLAYILTRPLGANLGDWLASPRATGGSAWAPPRPASSSSPLILATVIFLTLTRTDVLEDYERSHQPLVRTNTAAASGSCSAITASSQSFTGALLVWAAGQPHTAVAAEEEGPSLCHGGHGDPGPRARATSSFPQAEVVKFRSITADTLTSW